MKKKNNVMSNITERDKMLLYILFSILVLAMAYFLVFRPNMQKASETNAKNEELKYYITELDQKIAHQEEKEAAIANYNQERIGILNRFFGGMTYEKAVLIIADMMEQTGLEAEQIGITVNDVYFSQEEAMNNNLIQKENTSSVSSIAVQGVPEQSYDLLTGYKTTMGIDFSCSDDELTSVVDYINDYKEKLAIENIEVGYDETTGELAGTITVCMYSGDGVVDEEGNPKTYEEPEWKNMTRGVANLFGAKGNKKKKK